MFKTYFTNLQAYVSYKLAYLFTNLMKLLGGKNLVKKWFMLDYTYNVSNFHC